MKTTELIAKLEQSLRDHGDLEVFINGNLFSSTEEIYAVEVQKQNEYDRSGNPINSRLVVMLSQFMTTIYFPSSWLLQDCIAYLRHFRKIYSYRISMPNGYQYQAFIDDYPIFTKEKYLRNILPIPKITL